MQRDDLSLQRRIMSPTSEEERDEAGFFRQVELEAGAAEDVLDHGL